METKRDIRKMMTALRAAMSEKERAEAYGRHPGGNQQGGEGR